jgi:hypothetical protein
LAQYSFFWINYFIKTGDFQGLKPQIGCRLLLGVSGRKLMIELIPISILYSPEGFEPTGDVAGDFQSGPLKKRKDGLIRPAAGEGIYREVVDELHGPECVEPAMECRQNGFRPAVVLLQPLPGAGEAGYFQVPLQVV